jgi:hypothetical protein
MNPEGGCMLMNGRLCASYPRCQCGQSAMPFTHWSKDPLLPYNGCQCSSCEEVRAPSVSEFHSKAETLLANWMAEDSHPPCDAAHGHFEEFEPWDWCAIADEGLRLWNLMFADGTPAEDGSAISAPIHGVAAAAANGAFAAVAAALGVSPHHLQVAVSDYYWGPMDATTAPVPAPVGADGLMKLIDEAKASEDSDNAAPPQVT